MSHLMVMEALFGDSLLSKQGPQSLQEVLRAELILVYFSASWCGPCRGFTPVLQMFYEAVNSIEKKVEVIFVSRDKSQEQFNDYYAEMPWVAVPFNEQERINTLRETYAVKGIPKLILVKKDGTLILDTARADVEQKGPLALGRWTELSNS